MIAISRYAPATLAWVGVLAHLVVAGIVLRRPVGSASFPFLPALNLAVALSVLAYWVREWYGYATRGITWYATDQLVPLYAVVVAILAGAALVGRYDSRTSQAIQWVAFCVDAVVLGAAVLYFTFARFDRMM